MIAEVPGPDLMSRLPSLRARGSADVVAIIARFLPHIGGAQTHLFELGRRLVRRGHSVSVLTKAAPHSPAHEIVEGITVHRFDRPKLLGGDDSFASIYEHVKSRIFEHPTVLYVFLNVGTLAQGKTIWTIRLLELAREKSIPTVVRITSSGRVSRLAREYPRGIEVLRHTDCIVALNPGIQKELRDAGVGQSKIVFLPNGVDHNHFRPAAPTYTSPTSNGKMFLSASRLDPKKRLPDLLVLWGKYLNCLADSNSHLRIVAQPHDAKDTRDWLNIVEFAADAGLEHVDLVPGVAHELINRSYQNADVYITLSVEEGMSNALLEAMSTGLTVIAPATDAVKPLIVDDWNGFLFDPGSLASAAVAVARVMEAPAEKLQLMKRRSLDLVRERHAADLIAAAYSRLFNSVCSRR